MRTHLLGAVAVALLIAGCQSSARLMSDGPRSPKELAKAIDQILAEDQFQNANWAVLATDLNSNLVVYAHNEKGSFIPASNTKLYTTSAVLDQLGPEYTYETNVFTDGSIENGTLNGNLIIRGSGDPVIGGRFNDGDLTETFRTWAQELKDAGITSIAGDVIGDDDLFDDVPLGYGWSWDDEPYWYSAEMSALSFNDNCIDLRIESQTAGMPALIQWEPANTSFVDITNATITVEADSSLDEGYERSRGSNVFRIFSEVPEGRTDTESLTVRNPTLFFVHVLRETLLEQGISVSGYPVDIDDLSIKPNGAMTLLATHRSPPLKDIVTVLNKRSHNLYAEQVLRTLGVEFPVEDPDIEPGSAEMGLKRATDTFVAANVDTSRIQLVDGSGLSRQNLVTARMTASLLNYMYTHPDDSTRIAFHRSLPIGGVDGTIRSRFTDGPAHGRVFAKTGTVSNASALSGYVDSASGTPLSFVIMANHYTVPTSRVRDAQDRVVELLATYRR